MKSQDSVNISPTGAGNFFRRIFSADALGGREKVLRRERPVGLHGEAHHHHCPHCKSWMFTRTDGMDFFVNVRPTLLDDPSWYVPFAETQTAEKLPWATTPAVHSYERFPPMEAYGGLMKEFAERWAKG